MVVFGLLFAGCGQKRTSEQQAEATRQQQPSPRDGAQQRPTPQEERPQPPQQAEEPEPPRTPISVQVEKPTVKVADPKGRWTFQAQAESMIGATTQDGPYTMRRATGQYRRKGEAPVQMEADEIVVDQGAKRVTLIGSVRLRTPTMQVEAPRIEYNLETQQVRAHGPTKGTYSRPAVTSG